MKVDCQSGNFLQHSAMQYENFDHLRRLQWKVSAFPDKHMNADLTLIAQVLPWMKWRLLCATEEKWVNDLIFLTFGVNRGRAPGTKFTTPAALRLSAQQEKVWRSSERGRCNSQHYPICITQLRTPHFICFLEETEIFLPRVTYATAYFLNW